MGSQRADTATAEDDDQVMDFVTMGMFIIDDIEFPPPRPPVRDVLGGAGSWSALGARLFSPPPLSRSVGWIVDQGSDFPPSISDLIDSWSTGAVIRPTPDRLTTRGWNGYVDGSERRAFRYLTPKQRLTADDLSGPLLQARVFHLVCSPTRCRDLVTNILSRRKAEASAANCAYARPLFVWEPVPDRCVPDELLNCTNALPLVDICSPNHAELAGFMGSDGLDPETGEISTSAVEQNCEQLLASMPLQSYTLVIRAGEKGCYIAKNGGRKRPNVLAKKGEEKRKKKEYVRGGLRPDTDMEALFAGLLQDEEGAVVREEIEVDPGIELWLPAYHHHHQQQHQQQQQQQHCADNNNSDNGNSNGNGNEKANDNDINGAVDGASKVVDPTGGGNTFLGALAIALARGKNIEEACVWGNVAASFAIEQVGVPELGVDDSGRETWNRVRVEDRLREFQERVDANTDGSKRLRGSNASHAERC